MKREEIGSSLFFWSPYPSVPSPVPLPKQPTGTKRFGARATQEDGSQGRGRKGNSTEGFSRVRTAEKKVPPKYLEIN